MEKSKYVGKSVVRIDGKVKVSGAAKFIDDIDFGADLLYAAVVENFVTGKEFPYRFGLYMHDRYIFAQDRVRFVGEQRAAVIARTPATAKKAAELVKVNYTELPNILNLS